MRKIKVESGSSASDAARDFAKELHAKWGVGLVECDNGVLLLLSVDDRQVYISTGKGSQKELSNESLEVIIEWIKPYLKKGDFDEGLIRAVMNVGLGLSGWDIAADEPAMSFGLVLVIVFFATVGFSLISAAWYAFCCVCIMLFCADDLWVFFTEGRQGRIGDLHRASVFFKVSKRNRRICRKENGRRQRHVLCALRCLMVCSLKLAHQRTQQQNRSRKPKPY